MNVFNIGLGLCWGYPDPLLILRGRGRWNRIFGRVGVRGRLLCLGCRWRSNVLIWIMGCLGISPILWGCCQGSLLSGIILFLKIILICSLSSIYFTITVPAFEPPLFSNFKTMIYWFFADIQDEDYYIHFVEPIEQRTKI